MSWRPPRDASLGCILCVVVLAEVIQAFSAPENAVRMDEARDNACNDMGKMLQFVLPVATQIQQEVIKAYGFSCDGEGGSDAGRRWGGWGEGAECVGPSAAVLFLATGRQPQSNSIGTRSPRPTMNFCRRRPKCIFLKNIF